MQRDEGRRDPLAGLGSEPVEELGLVGTPAALARRPTGNGRRSPVRPAERRRRARKLGVTFSSAGIPDRLRALALDWGLMAPDGRSPNVSALVEYLLVPQLEAAEAGQVEPPEGG